MIMMPYAITKWSHRQNGLRLWTFGFSMKLWEKKTFLEQKTRVKKMHLILEIDIMKVFIGQSGKEK